MDLKIFKNNDKVTEAYALMVEKINAISEQYQLTFFEIFGIIECYKCDLIDLNINTKDED